MAEEAEAICEFNRLAEREGWLIRADSSLAFEARELIEALNVWRTARSEQPIPTRSALTPLAMKNFLPKVAVVDVIREPSRIRFRARLSGTLLDQTYGIKHGSIFDEVLAEPSRSRWQKTFELPVQLNAPVRTWGRVGYRDMTFPNAETLLAPMGNSQEPADSILVVVHLTQYQGDSTVVKKISSRAA